MPPSNNGLAPDYGSSIESHEDRLQRVESTLQEVVAQVAGINIKQDYMAQAMEQSRQDLADRIESGFGNLKQDTNQILSRVEAQETEIRAQGERLEPLEAGHSARQQRALDRKKFLRQISIGFLLAAAGVIGTKAAEILLGWGQ